jgi:hypothetical protein
MQRFGLRLGCFFFASGDEAEDAKKEAKAMKKGNEEPEKGRSAKVNKSKYCKYFII